jgi:hypothetical protein
VRRPKWSERGSQLGTEKLRLLPGGEVSALIDLVEVDLLSPASCVSSILGLVAAYFDSCYYAGQRIAAQTFFRCAWLRTRERRKSRASGAPNGLKPGRNVGVKIGRSS